MSEEIQKIKDAIESFFDKKDVALESRYFILKDMEMDYLDQIINDDDEDDDGIEDLDEGFEDAEENLEDEGEPEFEDVEEDIPDQIPDLELPEQVKKSPRIPVGKHGKSMRNKLMKRPGKVLKKPKVKVKE